MVAVANWYHASMDVVSRSQGRSAVGIASYVTGQRMKNTETGVWAKRNHPGDVLEFGTTAPEGAPDFLTDNKKLAEAWNAAQAAETRINSQLARHFNIALSREWSVPDQVEVMEDIAQNITDRYGVMTTWAVHAPTGHGDERNSHGHVVFNMREVTKEGFGKKARALVAMKTAKGELKWIREMIADEINGKMEELGLEERVSHLSYEERGIDREPTLHRGDKQNQMELKGRETEVGNENRAIEERNRQRETQRQLDRTIEELAALDREIAEEQERLLDARFGEPEADAGKDAKHLPGEKEANSPAPDEIVRPPLTPEEERQQVMQATSGYRRQIAETGEVEHTYEPGESWWQQTLDTVYEYYERARDYVIDRWQRLIGDRSPDPNTGPEMDGPDRG